MSDKLERLRALAEELTSYEADRKKSLKRLRELFERLELGQKCGEFSSIFDYKAINLSGINLTMDGLGEITEGKYVQIIGIKYVDQDGKRRAKNINLRYFGRVEQLDKEIKDMIVEFVLRWRLEKSYRGVDHYRELVKKCTAGAKKGAQSENAGHSVSS